MACSPPLRVFLLASYDFRFLIAGQTVGVGAPVFQPDERDLPSTRDGSSIRSSLRCSEYGKSVCVLRLGPQADNAATSGEDGGFVLSAFTGAVRWFRRDEIT